MKLTAAHAHLVRLGAPTLTTNDAAAALGISGTYANKVLARLAEAGHVVRLARGRWAFPDRLEPFALPEALTAPSPAYVSLLSALHHHEMIEQIPAAVFAVTIGTPREYETPLGTVSVHHVTPSFFFGYDQRGKGPKIATPEKALIDTLYFRQARSRRFRSLPELDLPRRFSRTTARSFTERIASPSRRSLVRTLLEEILAGSHVRS